MKKNRLMLMKSKKKYYDYLKFLFLVLGTATQITAKIAKYPPKTIAYNPTEIKTNVIHTYSSASVTSFHHNSLLF